MRKAGPCGGKKKQIPRASDEGAKTRLTYRPNQILGARIRFCVVSINLRSRLGVANGLLSANTKISRALFVTRYTLGRLKKKRSPGKFLNLYGQKVQKPIKKLRSGKRRYWEDKTAHNRYIIQQADIMYLTSGVVVVVVEIDALK